MQIGWDDIRVKDTTSNSSQDDSASKPAPSRRLKFEYITEVAPKISNFQADKAKPGYLVVLADEAEKAFYIYTGVGKHSVVYKQTMANVSMPKVDDYAKIPVKDSFFQELEKRPDLKTDSLIEKDAAEILRQIDEDCAKEQDELD